MAVTLEKFKEITKQKRDEFVQAKATELEGCLDAELLTGNNRYTAEMEFDEKTLKAIHQELEKRYKTAGWIGINLNFRVENQKEFSITAFSITAIG